jgi:hypothetical protein
LQTGYFTGNPHRWQMTIETPHLLVNGDAEKLAGGAAALEELCEAWGLTPIHKAKGFSFFEAAEIEAAIKRKQKRNEL